MGRGKLTAREKLRQAFLEEKAGIENAANTDARLFVEKEEADEAALVKELEAKSKAAAAAAAAPQSAEAGSALGSSATGLPLTMRKRKKKVIQANLLRIRYMRLICV